MMLHFVLSLVLTEALSSSCMFECLSELSHVSQHEGSCRDLLTDFGPKLCVEGQYTFEICSDSKLAEFEKKIPVSSEFPLYIGDHTVYYKFGACGQRDTTLVAAKAGSKACYAAIAKQHLSDVMEACYGQGSVVRANGVEYKGTEIKTFWKKMLEKDSLRNIDFPNPKWVEENGREDAYVFSGSWISDFLNGRVKNESWELQDGKWILAVDEFEYAENSWEEWSECVGADQVGYKRSRSVQIMSGFCNTNEDGQTVCGDHLQVRRQDQICSFKPWHASLKNEVWREWTKCAGNEKDGFQRLRSYRARGGDVMEKPKVQKCTFTPVKNPDLVSCPVYGEPMCHAIGKTSTTVYNECELKDLEKDLEKEGAEKETKFRTAETKTPSLSLGKCEEETGLTASLKTLLATVLNLLQEAVHLIQKAVE